jgi:hypothetical protein
MLRIRTVQQVLLDNLLAAVDLRWIQRWAALLPELVGDFDHLFDQSHSATKLRTKLRLAGGPAPGGSVGAKANVGRKSRGQSTKNNNDNTE